MKNLVIALIVGVSLISIPVINSAPFSNGSFENPQIAHNSQASAGVLANWDINGYVQLVNGQFGYITFPPRDGSQHLLFNSGDTATGGFISQTFDTIPGGSYAVSFYVGSFTAGGVGTMQIQASAISATSEVLGTYTGVAGPGYGIEHKMTFIATTPTTTLIFQDTSTATFRIDLMLDHISVFQENSIKIETITLSSGGVIHEDGTLDFAAGDDTDWGNTLPDEIRCVADLSTIPDPHRIKWTITDLSSGEATPAETTEDMLAFRITDLPEQDLFETRDAIQFTVVVQLLEESGNELARDEKTVTQSTLGRRRQEYVDHPVDPVGRLPKVPPPSDFNGANQIVSAWAAAAELLIVPAAAANNTPTTRSRIYSSPVEHWIIYRNQGRPVNTHSQHMWGVAVDFATRDYRPPHRGVPGPADWAQLSTLIRSWRFRVVPEGRWDHVHIQEYDLGGQPY